MRSLLLLFILLSFPSHGNACAVAAKPATEEMMNTLPPHMYGFKAEIISVTPIQSKAKTMPIQNEIETMFDSIREEGGWIVKATVLKYYGMPLEEQITFKIGVCGLIPKQNETSYFIATQNKENKTLDISQNPAWDIQEEIRKNPYGLEHSHEPAGDLK